MEASLGTRIKEGKEASTTIIEVVNEILFEVLIERNFFFALLKVLEQSVSS